MTQPATDLAAQFVAQITPKRRNPDRPVVEDDEFVAMIWRQLRALEARAINNAELLPQLVALAQRLAEMTNVVIAVSAERYAVNPYAAPSMAECARVLGISKQSASERRARGVATVAARVEAAGAAKFSEARREREAIAAAAQHAVANLDDYRARHRKSA